MHSREEVSKHAHSGLDESFHLHEHPSWQHPYRNARIYFHRDVVRGLSSQALRYLRRETEIGGILWGKIGPGESVTILDATPVPSAGPRFNTTGVDARNLLQAMSGQAPQASLALVGYFRSHLREGLSLTPQDRILIEQNIRDPEAVFTLIKPFEAGACTAAFFFWRDGRLQDFSDLEVPFIAIDERPSRDSPRARTRPEPSPVAEFSSSVPQGPARQSRQPYETIAKPSKNPLNSPLPPGSDKEPGLLLVLAIVLISVLGLIAGAEAYWMWPELQARRQSAPPKPLAAGIDLRVSRASDGQLSLSWNQNAPEIIKARSAILSITDGPASPELNLDNEQLRSGQLMYFPKTADVQFRLELNIDSQHAVAESVWVLSPGATSPHRRKRLPVHHSAQVSRATLVAGQTLGTVTSPAHVPATTAKYSLPLVAVPTTRIPSTQFVPGSAYAPPRAIEEMMPQTAPLGQFAQISVQVSIDPAGHVTAARATGNGANRDYALADSAVAAARQWRFQPATLNGRPVSAEYTILFAFRAATP